MPEQPVSDPSLISQLDQGAKPVTDPGKIAQLEKVAQPAAPKKLNSTEQSIVDQTMGKRGQPDNSGKLGPTASSIVRPVAQAATALPLMAADAGVAGGNLLRRGAEALSGRPPEKQDKDMELPGNTFEKFLDTYTQKPQGFVGKAAEAVSSALVGGVGSIEGGVERSIRQASSVAGKETVKQASYREARAAGLRVSPTEQEGGSDFMKNAASVGGKPRVEKEVSAHNTQRIDDLGRNALGLRENHPLDEMAMENVRDEAGRAYERIATIGKPVKTDDQMINDVLNVGFDVEQLEREAPGFNKESTMRELDRIRGSMLQDKFSPASMIKMIRSLRKDARMNMKTTNDPDKWATGVFQRQASDLLESRLERFAQQEAGDPQLVDDMRNARRLIARTYSVEDALNTQTGHIDAHVLAKLADSGVPLDAELRTIANFAKAFPKSSQSVDKVGTGQGMTSTELMVAAAAFAYHHPVVAAVATGRSAGRAVASSELSQPRTLVKGAKDGLSPATLPAAAAGAEDVEHENQ